MVEVPRRAQRISVALPASLTRDIPHLREKTSRAGMIARALAIFRVDEVIIYDDVSEETSRREGVLLAKLLAYQETPQYLRRKLFPRDPDLQFAGILPPLRLQSHPKAEDPRLGLIRDAIVAETGPGTRVDAGFSRTVKVASRLREFARVTIRLTKVDPYLEGELVDASRLPIYWGFRIIREGITLGQLLRREQWDLTISTSQKGQLLGQILSQFQPKWKTSHRTVVAFGSPDQGVPDILAREAKDVNSLFDFNINTIPRQGVETIRTEEAVLATLSIFNLLEET